MHNADQNRSDDLMFKIALALRQREGDNDWAINPELDMMLNDDAWIWVDDMITFPGE
jgi:hypothetical protein